MKYIFVSIIFIMVCCMPTIILANSADYDRNIVIYDGHEMHIISYLDEDRNFVHDESSPLNKYFDDMLKYPLFYSLSPSNGKIIWEIEEETLYLTDIFITFQSGSSSFIYRIPLEAFFSPEQIVDNKVQAFWYTGTFTLADRFKRHYHMEFKKGKLRKIYPYSNTASFLPRNNISRIYDKRYEEYKVDLIDDILKLSEYRQQLHDAGERLFPNSPKLKLYHTTFYFDENIRETDYRSVKILYTDMPFIYTVVTIPSGKTEQKTNYTASEYTQIVKEAVDFISKHTWLIEWLVTDDDDPNDKYNDKNMEIHILADQHMENFDKYVFPAWSKAGFTGYPKYEVVLFYKEMKFGSIYFPLDGEKAFIRYLLSTPGNYRTHWIDQQSFFLQTSQANPSYIIVSQNGEWSYP